MTDRFAGAGNCPSPNLEMMHFRFLPQIDTIDAASGGSASAASPFERWVLGQKELVHVAETSLPPAPCGPGEGSMAFVRL